jgi:hypothetical protein
MYPGVPGAAFPGFPGCRRRKGNGLADGWQLKGANKVPAPPARTDKSVLDNRRRVLFPDQKDASGSRLACAENFHTVHAFSKGPVIKSVISLGQDCFAPRSIEGESEPPRKFGHTEAESAWRRRSDVGNDWENPNQSRMVTDLHEHYSFRICVISATSWPGFSLPHRVFPLPTVSPVLLPLVS